MIRRNTEDVKNGELQHTIGKYKSIQLLQKAPWMFLNFFKEAIKIVLLADVLEVKT